MWREVVELVRVLDAVEEVAGSRRRNEAAILFDWEAWWGCELDSHPSVDVRYLDRAEDLHRALSGAGRRGRRRAPRAPTSSAYRLVVVPTLYLVTDATVAAVAAAAEAGATVVVTYFSGIVDEHDHIRLGGYPGAFRELLGVRVEEFLPLREGETVRVEGWAATPSPPTSGPRTSSWPAPRRSRRTSTARRRAARRHPARGRRGRRVVRRHPARPRRHRPAGRAAGRRGRRRAAARRRRPASRSPGGSATTRRWLFVINHGDEAAPVAVTGVELVTGRDVAGDLVVPAGGVAVVRRSRGLMLAAQRRSRILAELSRDGTVRVTDLVELLGVSDMTVRRDLVALHREGLLEKVHGGALAVAEPSLVRAGLRGEVGAAPPREGGDRRRARPSWCTPGMAIAVSAGTTTHALAEHLARHPRPHRRHQLGLGGRRAAPQRATPPPRCCSPAASARRPTRWSARSRSSSLRSLHVDAFFMGVHGMDVRAGFSTPNLLESETNRAMIERSRRLIVCADSSKWGVVGLSSMADLSEAAVLVTDSGLSAQASGVLADHVGELVLVDPVDDDETTSRRRATHEHRARPPRPRRRQPRAGPRRRTASRRRCTGAPRSATSTTPR